MSIGHYAIDNIFYFMVYCVFHGLKTEDITDHEIGLVCFSLEIFLVQREEELGDRFLS